VTTATKKYTEEQHLVAGKKAHLVKGGKGPPLLVLNHEVGSFGWTPFLEGLAENYSVYQPHHPGFDKSERPEWMRSVRDLAIAHEWLLRDLKLGPVDVIGLGFGGWVAAEMATMNHSQFKHLVLVAPMGIQPPPGTGEIVDQELLSGHEYMRKCFHDQAKLDAMFGKEPAIDQLEAWEINREMTTRIAWKPYMFNQTLPYLIQGVQVPTLVVFGKQDQVAPLSCGKRYVDLLPKAKLEIVDNAGHCVEMEQPQALLKLVTSFLAK